MSEEKQVIWHLAGIALVVPLMGLTIFFLKGHREAAKIAMAISGSISILFNYFLILYGAWTESAEREFQPWILMAAGHFLWTVFMSSVVCAYVF